MFKKIPSLFGKMVGSKKEDFEKLDHALSQGDEFSHIAASLSAPLLSSDSENDENGVADSAAATLQKLDEAGAQDNTPIKLKSAAIKPLPNQALGYIQSLETIQNESKLKIKLKASEYLEFCKAHPAKAAGCALAGTLVATVSAAAVVGTGGLAAGAILAGTAGELTLASAASGGAALVTGGVTVLGAIATDAVLAAGALAAGWFGAKTTGKAIITKQDVIDFKEVQAAAALMEPEAEPFFSKNSTSLDNSDIPLNTLSNHHYDNFNQNFSAVKTTFSGAMSVDLAVRSIIKLCLTKSVFVQEGIAHPSFTQILKEKGKEVKKLLQININNLSHVNENADQNVSELISIIAELISGSISEEQLHYYKISKHDQVKIRDIFVSIDLYNERQIISYLYPEDLQKQENMLKSIEPHDEASKIISRIAKNALTNINAELSTASEAYILSPESQYEDNQSQPLGLNDDLKET